MSVTKNGKAINEEYEQLENDIDRYQNVNFAPTRPSARRNKATVTEF